MKRIKIVLFVFGFSLFIPKIVGAQCGHSEKSVLQPLANNLNFTYNYIETDNGINSSVNFNITITNLSPELYVVDQNNEKVYYYNDNKEVTINSYRPGSTIKFIVYAKNGECKGRELLTNYVTLPYYNPFYKDPVCTGAVDYNLCKRWTLVNLTHDEFVKRVENYKNQIKNEIPTIEDDITLFEKIINFISEYILVILVGIIVICSILIFYLSRKDDFDLG